MSINSQQTYQTRYVITSANKRHFSHGWYWINQGFRYFTLAKKAWIISLFLLMISLVCLIYLLPIFKLALLFLMPFFSAGLSLGCSDIERNKGFDFKYLIKGFVQLNSFNIFRYGFWLLLLMIVASMFSSILLSLMGVSPDQINAELILLQNSDSVSIQAIYDSSILSRYFLISFIVMLPISVVNMFAPLIIIFSNFTAINAIKYGLIAAYKNASALLFYAFIYLVVIIAIIFILKAVNVILFSVFGADSIFTSLISLTLTFIMIMGFAAITYCSTFAAFKDIFIGE